MKRGTNHYTEKEIKVIITQLQSYPENKKHAFRVASSLLKTRNATSIAYYYYNHLSKQQTITTTGSCKGFTSNVKNVRVNSNGELKRKEPLKPLYIMIKMLMDLSKEDLIKTKEIINQLI